MKNLLILLSLTIVFACHTKEEQAKSGVNDPINLVYNDADSSVVQASASTVSAPPAPQDIPSPAAASCIDTSKIQPDMMCTQEFQPVCGCDNKEYSNKCEAEKAGVTTWTEGPCAQNQGKSDAKGETKPTSEAKPAELTKEAKKETTAAKKKKKKAVK